MKYSKKTLARHARAFEAAANRAQRISENGYSSDPDYKLDRDEVKMYRQDARDNRTIARRLRKGDVAGARRKHESMDTAAQEEVNMTTFDWLWRW